MLLSNCALCDRKELKFMKDQEAIGLSGNLVIRTLLSIIPLVGPLLF